MFVNRSARIGNLIRRQIENSQKMFHCKLLLRNQTILGYRRFSSLSPVLMSSSGTDGIAGSDLNLNLQQFPKHILRRALLYVPGNDQRKIKKIKPMLRDIDTVVLDCEDGVAINRKEEARNTILSTLNEWCPEPVEPPAESQSEDSPKPSSVVDPDRLWERVSVRINSVDSGLAEDDLKVVLSGKMVPRTLLLPKVESKEHIDWFLDKLSKALKKRDKPAPNEQLSMDLVIYVESARGLLDLRDICQHSIEMYEYAPIRLAGIVFGSDDFCANIGATRTDAGHEVMMARQQVVMIAKAFDLQAIDSVYINFKDLAGLELQAREGALIGFTGKQAIHPVQVATIQQAFQPCYEKIIWARGLIAGFEQAQSEGRGAFVYQGQMIDMPLLRQAYNILQFDGRDSGPAVHCDDPKNNNNNNNNNNPDGQAH